VRIIAATNRDLETQVEEAGSVPISSIASASFRCISAVRERRETFRAGRVFLCRLQKALGGDSTA